MKNLIFLILICISFVTATAQKAMYFDKQGVRVVKSMAHTYKIIEKSESKLWKVSVFTKNDVLKGIYYSNRKDGSVLHGVSVTYYKPKGKNKQNDHTEQIKSRQHFINGEKNGLCEVFYRSGALKMKTIYNEDRIVGEQKVYYNTG